jgi:hypothetical protein
VRPDNHKCVRQRGELEYEGKRLRDQEGEVEAVVCKIRALERMPFEL